MKHRVGRPFEKGNKAHAGKVSGGRPPDWLKNKCQELIDKHKIIEFIVRVANGEDVEQVVSDQGEVLRVPASVKDRIRAAEILLDRGFGKAAQPLEHSGEITTPPRIIFELATRDQNTSNRGI
jgi:hypothetical protein